MPSRIKQAILTAAPYVKSGADTLRQAALRKVGQVAADPLPLFAAIPGVGGPLALSRALGGPRPGIPAQMRWLAQSLLGQKQFTEDDLTPTELADLQRTAAASIRRQAAGSPEMGIQYRDYQKALGIPKGGVDPKSVRALLPHNAMPLSVGRANIVRGETAESPDRITDTYDFVNSARAADAAEYARLKEQDGYLPVLAKILRSAGQQGSLQRALMSLPGELGEAFVSEGSDVNIALPEKLPALKTRSVRSRAAN